MKGRKEHHITRLKFNVKYPDSENGLSFKDEFADFAQMKLSKVIDNALERHDVQGAVIEVGKLELDISIQGLNGYKDKLEQALFLALDEKLHKLMQINMLSKGEEEFSIISLNDSEKDTYISFLQKGQLPSEAIAPQDTLASFRENFIERIKEDPKFKARVVEVLKDRKSRIRFIRTFTKQEWDVIFKSLDASEDVYAQVDEFVHYLDNIFNDKVLKESFLEMMLSLGISGRKLKVEDVWKIVWEVRSRKVSFNVLRFFETLDNEKAQSFLASFSKNQVRAYLSDDWLKFSDKYRMMIKMPKSKQKYLYDVIGNDFISFSKWEKAKADLIKVFSANSLKINVSEVAIELSFWEQLFLSKPVDNLENFYFEIYKKLKSETLHLDILAQVILVSYIFLIEDKVVFSEKELLVDNLDAIAEDKKVDALIKKMNNDLGEDLVEHKETKLLFEEMAMIRYYIMYGKLPTMYDTTLSEINPIQLLVKHWANHSQYVEKLLRDMPFAPTLLQEVDKLPEKLRKLILKQYNLESSTVELLDFSNSQYQFDINLLLPALKYDDKRLIEEISLSFSSNPRALHHGLESIMSDAVAGPIFFESLLKFVARLKIQIDDSFLGVLKQYVAKGKEFVLSVKRELSTPELEKVLRGTADKMLVEKWKRLLAKTEVPNTLRESFSASQNEEFVKEIALHLVPESKEVNLKQELIDFLTLGKSLDRSWNLEVIERALFNYINSDSNFKAIFLSHSNKPNVLKLLDKFSYRSFMEVLSAISSEFVRDWHQWLSVLSMSVVSISKNKIQGEEAIMKAWKWLQPIWTKSILSQGIYNRQSELIQLKVVMEKISKSYAFSSNRLAIQMYYQSLLTDESVADDIISLFPKVKDLQYQWTEKDLEREELAELLAQHDDVMKEMELKKKEADAVREWLKEQMSLLNDLQKLVRENDQQLKELEEETGFFQNSLLTISQELSGLEGQMTKLVARKEVLEVSYNETLIDREGLETERLVWGETLKLFLSFAQDYEQAEEKPEDYMWLAKSLGIELREGRIFSDKMGVLESGFISAYFLILYEDRESFKEVRESIFEGKARFTEEKSREKFLQKALSKAIAIRVDHNKDLAIDEISQERMSEYAKIVESVLIILKLESTDADYQKQLDYVIAKELSKLEHNDDQKEEGALKESSGIGEDQKAIEKQFLEKLISDIYILKVFIQFILEHQLLDISKVSFGNILEPIFASYEAVELQSERIERLKKNISEQKETLKNFNLLVANKHQSIKELKEESEHIQYQIKQTQSSMDEKSDNVQKDNKKHFEVEQRLMKIEEELEKAKKKIRYEFNDLPENVSQPVYVNNAGLVLLHPFLPRLFKMLELRDNKGFHDRESQEKAVYVLQYLVSKRTDIPEQELYLNKVMCGYPLEEPLPVEIELTEKDMNTCDGLLSSVLDHWKGAKTKDIDNLRATFLMREGKVVNEGGRVWRVTVEKKTVDILLGQLPWSLGMIKYPWLEVPIEVEWY
ncbi:contractile injection system tape measure protein [Aureibacter tunicatorum]|uniref:Uncharacterized protein n=1 Tax=Aureibacter tunicatorum TaxID=866807 RepID=A0AAE3XIN8_9BACT|nr:contractile injection system tape measure protein [Aureibacter tunicatorum]MDR6237423.1 hypothetical protein [Aureibacter tunicatorum]BDD06413.1 hypothetical protein AUTU_38960 [Aureibacter tunicatorum]